MAPKFLIVLAATAGLACGAQSAGSLDSPKGSCPLKHTAVQAEITGFTARVNVTQVFQNPFRETIEAVYTFPLPNRAAVDSMVMLIGDRTVRGKIKRREEARAIYEEARSRGRTAGLLDQERPNIFTQSVANILAGQQVKITISYVETLNYEEGEYGFVFPMVVGPRYIPGRPAGQQGGGWSPDTDRVPDASRITPPVARPGTRAGHDISVEVALDAGMPVDRLRSVNHEIDFERPSATRARVRLRERAVIPNRDFVLRYDVAGRRISDAVLTHRGSRGGFFTLILQPPERVTLAEVTPKELVFVLDTSGSMSGFPIEKAKETMKLALESLYPQDTFNLITFAGDTHILFPSPAPASEANLRRAQEFLAARRGSGGTEMMKAVRAALEASENQAAVRIVCFMTDGYVGNEAEIIAEVGRHPNARVFSFGIGNSVNRYLLDKMAEIGRGEVEYVSLNEDGSAAAKRFHERVRNPLLTDVSIDWGGLPVQDVYPKRVPDLFAAKALVLSGRYSGAARGMIRINGKVAGRPWSRQVFVDLPAGEARHDVLPVLWARNRIEDLLDEQFAGEEARERVTELALEYQLMSPFTSFVAVEEMTVTEGGQPRRVEVPVEMPEGVSYEGVFGRENEVMASTAPASMMAGAAQRVAASPRMMLERADIRLRSPAEMRREKDASRMHAEVARAVEAYRKGLAPQARFIRNGKAELQVWLADTSAATLARLKALGFVIVARPNGTLLVGRLPVAKLAALAEMQGIRYVAPWV
ncbi:MAG: VWA domain-containing protein [Bryobacterales bacterium]|nr:VWA domain-containing protein [Bryobacterales bacterium]